MYAVEIPLTLAAASLVYFVFRLWRARSFFSDLQKRGLVSDPSKVNI
jgi:hypothetical protein